MSEARPQPAPADSPKAAQAAKPPRLKSMTGYAHAQAAFGGFSLRVSVRSVNHRFLDLHLRVPEGFEPVEPRMRQIVRERVRRGHLDLTVRYELAGPAAVGVNQEVAAAYLEAVALAAGEILDPRGARSCLDSAPARGDRPSGCITR